MCNEKSNSYTASSIQYFARKNWSLVKAEFNGVTSWILSSQYADRCYVTFESLSDVWEWWKIQVRLCRVDVEAADEVIAVFRGTSDDMRKRMLAWARSKGAILLPSDFQCMLDRAYFQQDYSAPWRPFADRFAPVCGLPLHEHYFSLVNERLSA
jgi:hypothetical protein